MNDKILWKLNEDINRVLKEELGIADDVKNATNEIYEYIVKEYKNKKYQEDRLIEDGVGQKYGNFYLNNVFGYKILVETILLILETDFIGTNISRRMVVIT